ncbi:Hypothetical protein CAP_6600 [Chondromyces apiculatus DSM 436]|uniref:Uncharacterized protein n=1 Tax=Chondromyces apiculatus DSM 436 TaxID=1192034 RepID=A0A017T1I4_9BACT|nr:Hypothetical protein CAP_6600 [Chondromyces apiculatus DSM 436]
MADGKRHGGSLLGRVGLGGGNITARRRRTGLQKVNTTTRRVENFRTDVRDAPAGF